MLYSLRSIIQILIFLVLSHCSSINKNFNHDKVRRPQSVAEIKLNQDSWQYFPSMNINELRSKMVEMNYIGTNQKHQISFPTQNQWDQALNNLFESAVDVVENHVGKGMGPRPRLAIFNTESPNAFVAAATSCLGIPLVGQGGEGSNGYEVPEFRSIGGRPTLTVSFNSFCQSYLSSEERADFIGSVKGEKYFRGKLECQFDENQNDPTQLSVHCEKRSISEPDLLIHKTLPFVFVNRGLLATLQTWEEVLAVIFHELGHYYLPHLNAREAKRYDYFYSQKNQQSPWFPTEDSSLNKTGDILLYLGKIKTVRPLESFYHTEVSTQILKAIVGRPHLLYKGASFDFNEERCVGVQGSVKQYTDAGGLYGKGYRYLQKAVGPFREKMNQQLRDFNYGEKAGTQNKRHLLQSLHQLKGCIETVVINSTQENDIEFVKEAFDASSVEYSKQSLQYIAMLIDGLPFLDPLAFFLKDQRIPEFKNAWEAYRFVDASFKIGLENLTSEPRYRDIGIYTTEEEADIFTVEMLALVDLVPETMKAALFSIMGKVTSHPNYVHTSAEPSFEACKEANANSWLVKGEPFKPALSDYSSKHHNFCHRIYNMTRFESFNNLGGGRIAKFISPSLKYSLVKRKNSELISSKSFK